MNKYHGIVKGDLKIFEKYFLDSISSELGSTRIAGSVEEVVGDTTIHVHILEKYFMRNNSFSSLTVTLFEKEGEIEIHGVAAGSGIGFFGLDWGVKDRWVEAVVQAVRQWNTRFGGPAKEVEDL